MIEVGVRAHLAYDTVRLLRRGWSLYITVKQCLMPVMILCQVTNVSLPGKTDANEYGDQVQT